MKLIYIGEIILTGILSIIAIGYGIYNLIQSYILLGCLNIFIGLVWIGCCLLFIKLNYFNK